MTALYLAAIDPISAGNEFARHAEGWPMTVGFFMMFALFAAAFAWVLMRGWPQWLTEQQTSREHRERENDKMRTHIDTMLGAARSDAAKAVDAERTASDKRHEAIVTRVVEKVDRLHEKVDEQARRTGAIAAKLGVGALVALVLGAAVYGMLQRPPIDPALAESCNPPCSVGQKCSGSPPKCVEDKKDLPAVTKPRPPKKPEAEPNKVATVPDGGHSAARRVVFVNLATVACNSRHEVCL